MGLGLEFLGELGCLATLLAILGLLSSIIQLWVSNEGSDPPDEQDAAHHDHGHRAQLQREGIILRPLIGGIDAVANAIHGHSKHRRTHERAQTKNEKITIVVLGVTGFFALTAAIAAGYSAWIFQGQLEEARVENRPWVKLSDIRITQLAVQKDQILVWADYSFINVGRSPAAAVWVYPEFVVSGVETIQQAKMSCEYLRHKPWLISGNVLFPKDLGELKGSNFGMPMREILRKRDETVNAVYDMQVKGMGKAEADSLLPITVKMWSHMAFSVIGCVAYTFDGSLETHGTSFVFDVTEKATDGTDHGIDITVPSIIKGDDLRVARSIMGAYAH